MKPTVPEVLPAVRELYRRAEGGCCLHIVLEEGNVSDDNVRFCVEYAREKGHAECLALAETLLLMSKTQRGKLWSLAYQAEKR